MSQNESYRQVASICKKQLVLKVLENLKVSDAFLVLKISVRKICFYCREVFTKNTNFSDNYITKLITVPEVILKCLKVLRIVSWNISFFIRDSA